MATLKSTLKQPLLIDFRNLYDPATVRATGLTYIPLGRP